MTAYLETRLSVKEDGFLPGVPHLHIKTRESTSDKLSRLKIETC